VDAGSTLLERDAELTRLHTVLRECSTRGGRIAVVRGEAGIGKTTLVRRFVDEVSDGADVVAGACDDLSTPQPLAPIWDIARERPRIAAALRLGERRAVMDALLNLLSGSGEPSVVVLEDAHWADDATLDVITFVGRRIDRANGLLVLTYRDTEIAAAHPLRRVLGVLPPGVVERIRLRPLTLDAVATLSGRRGVHAEQLLTLTGGNPLFVTEVAASGEGAVPLSVRDAVMAQLAQLSGAVRDVVELVAMIPGRMRWALLSAIIGPERDLREGVQHGLLEVSDDGVGFRHELQRRAVEDSLSPDDRRRRHQRVLAALPDDADPARLVHHARAAGDVDAVLAHAPRAGRAAMAVHSHREARAHFQTIGPHLHRLPMREAADLADDWARVALNIDGNEAGNVVQRAADLRRRIGDRRALSRTLALGAFTIALCGQRDEGRRWAAEAVELADDGESDAELAYALTEQARLHSADGDAAVAVVAVRRAVAIGERIGDGRTTASARILDGVIRLRDGDPTSTEVVDRARREAAAGGHPFEEADALLALAVTVAMRYDDLARAATYLDRSRAIADEYEYDDLSLFVQAGHAELSLLRGEWTAAEDRAADVLAAAPPPDAEANALRVLAIAAVRRGSSDAGEAVDAMWEAATGVGLAYVVDGAAATLAEHLWVSAAGSDVRLPALDRVLARRLTGPIEWMSDDLVFWMWKLDRLPVLPSDLLDGFRSILDGDTAGAAHFWAARGMPYHEAVALMHGDDGDAVRAVHRFEDLGADAAARRLRGLLRERGVTVPRGRSRSSRAHAAGLTARQAEVMALLADGMSNVEIADHLVISHRTVENHVAALLRKLEVSTRDEAVAAARTRGLLDQR
jgi:DNA-binding CsgD family transcriptional regulator